MYKIQSMFLMLACCIVLTLCDPYADDVAAYETETEHGNMSPADMSAGYGTKRVERFDSHLGNRFYTYSGEAGNGVKRLPNYNFGLGKRYAQTAPYSFGLGKRAGNNVGRHTPRHNYDPSLYDFLL